MDEVLKALAAAVTAVLAVWLAHQLQSGSGRRRLRREVTEELQLLALLDEGPLKTKLSRRVQDLLAEYERLDQPSPTVTAHELPTSPLIIVGATAVVASFILDAVLAPPEWLILVGLGVVMFATAIISTELTELTERRSRRRNASPPETEGTS